MNREEYFKFIKNSNDLKLKVNSDPYRLHFHLMECSLMICRNTVVLLLLHFVFDTLTVEKINLCILHFFRQGNN